MSKKRIDTGLPVAGDKATMPDEFVTLSQLNQTLEEVPYADAKYIHQQLIASDTWEVAHNLGKHPAVRVVDSAHETIQGHIKDIDDNNLIIKFNNMVAGVAYCN